MNHYPPAVVHLIHSLCTLPGVGQKTAERLALHLLHAPEHEVSAIATGILDVRKKVRVCSVCFNLAQEDRCRICQDPRRNPSLICVVESPADLAAIEKSHVYSGLYHILGGALSPIDGIGPEDIRVRELMRRADPRVVQEIILATRTTVEGQATASYIQSLLQDIPLRISRIASGVPMGGDLQYVDALTIGQAMEKRCDF